MKTNKEKQAKSIKDTEKEVMKQEEIQENPESTNDTAETIEEPTNDSSETSEATEEQSSEKDNCPEPSFEKELEQCEKEKQEYQDKYIRLVAEFDNYRKRVLREKSELILNGGEKVIISILPVLDDIERAEENMLGNPDTDSSLQGVQLIFDKLKDTLNKHGLTKIESVGETFDVNVHEAIAMVPGQPDDLRGKVIDCVQEGYKLNDKVIRHAKVAVAE